MNDFYRCKVGLWWNRSTYGMLHLWWLFSRWSSSRWISAINPWGCPKKPVALVWLVVEPYPSEKSWSERQMGWLFHSQLNGKSYKIHVKKCSKPPTTSECCVFVVCFFLIFHYIPSYRIFWEIFITGHENELCGPWLCPEMSIGCYRHHGKSIEHQFDTIQNRGFL